MAALSQSARQDVLAATALFAGLSREDLAVLAALAAETFAPRDTRVVRRGDPDCSLMVLITGRLRAGVVSAEGREVTLGVMEAGNVLGEIALLDGGARSLDVTAMIDSHLLVVDRASFLPFLTARPALMLRLMTLLCDRLRRSSAAFEDVALASLSARLARVLLDLAAQHGRKVDDGIRIRVRVNQRELSAQVAATRERVNKQLRQWHEQGLLGEMEGDMVVRQPEALRKLVA